MSTAPQSPVTGDPDGARGHRLSGAEAEAIAARVWPTGDLAPWLMTLYVRAVDAGRPWVESYLAAAEKAAVRAEIEAIAPRDAGPARWRPLGDVLGDHTMKKSEGETR